MLDDIVARKDDVSFVLVYKLSRFGRNVADILGTLKTMRFYGVHLIYGIEIRIAVVLF